MRLDEFLSEIYEITENKKMSEEIKVKELFAMICKDYKIQFTEVYTNYVFLRVVNMNDCKYLLWDMSYWSFYEKFLENCSYLTYSVMNEKKWRKKDRDKINSILTDMAGDFGGFLALSLVDYPYYRYEFAREYYLINHSVGIKFRERDISDEVLQCYKDIAKCYCLFHEINHVRYIDDENIKKAEFQQLTELINYAKVVVEKGGDKYTNKFYKCRKKTFLYTVNECIKSDSIREEILCDIQAFNQCFLFYSNIYRDQYTQEQIIDMFLESIQLIEFFNNTLVTLKESWMINIRFSEGNINKKYRKEMINELNMKLRQRFYLKEIISYLQLFSITHANEILLHIGKNFCFKAISDKDIMEKKFERVLFSKHAFDSIQRNVDLIPQCNINEIKSQIYLFLGLVYE